MERRRREEVMVEERGEELAVLSLCPAGSYVTVVTHTIRSQRKNT